MTDVINGKNRKQRVSNKVVLPIFTQHLRLRGGCFFYRNTFPQNEQRFSEFIQINIL